MVELEMCDAQMGNGRISAVVRWLGQVGTLRCWQETGRWPAVGWCIVRYSGRVP